MIDINNKRAMVRVEINHGAGYSMWFEWPHVGNPGEIAIGVKADDCPESAIEPCLQSIPVVRVGTVTPETVVSVFKQILGIDFRTESTIGESRRNGE